MFTVKAVADPCGAHIGQPVQGSLARNYRARLEVADNEKRSSLHDTKSIAALKSVCLCQSLAP